MTKESGMNDHEEVGAAGEHPPLRRPRRSSSANPKLAWLIAGGVALAALVVLAAVLWVNQPRAAAPNTVTVQGTEYVTNVEVEAQGGYVYVYLPVNTDPEAVVLEVSDEADSQRIREFLGGLDTLVPGEHVVSLSESNLHFIVDGIDGVGGSTDGNETHRPVGGDR